MTEAPCELSVKILSSMFPFDGHGNTFCVNISENIALFVRWFHELSDKIYSGGIRKKCPILPWGGISHSVYLK